MIELNIPNCLTLLRITTLPFFFITFYFPFLWSRYCCTTIFVIAAVTDWFDGFLARKWKQNTCFGEFLDPIADKIITVMALILIVEHFHSFWITFPISIMIVREVVISALREWIAKIGKETNITVSPIGKIKTTIQMLSITALLLRSNIMIVEIGIIFLYISLIFTFWSMCKYFYIVKQSINK